MGRAAAGPQGERSVEPGVAPAAQTVQRPRFDVGAVDDPLEREADAMADAVVSRLATGTIAPAFRGGAGRIRRATGRIQRLGDDPPDYDALKAKCNQKITEKAELLQQLKTARDAMRGPVAKAARERLRLRTVLLERKVGELQVEIDGLLATMTPLYQAQLRAKDEAAAAEKSKADAAAKAEAEARAKAEEEARKKAEEEAAAKKAADEEEARKKAEEERIAREDAKYKQYAEIIALKLDKFVAYVEGTPNWHLRSTITDPEKEHVRAIHAWALTGSNQATCIAMTPADMLGQGKPIAEVLTALEAYVRCAGPERDPIQLPLITNVAAAVTIGATLTKMLTAFESWVLSSALTSAELIDIARYGLVDRLIEYYSATNKPTFQAERGADFRSYIALVRVDKINPVAVQRSALGQWVRNIHRFEGAALQGLLANLADRSKTKPLTLILHSALDHNGAFHRDPKLTAVITNTNNLTLMYEGAKTLAGYQANIGPIARAYGNNDKLDQVMIAGHGGSRRVQLAGSISEKPLDPTKPDKDHTITENVERINLDADLPAAQAFFDAILDNMDPADVDPLLPGPDKQRNRRILFNACLTNSNTVRTALSRDQARARVEITDYLRDNSSLATYMQQYATTKGRDVTSLGANASIGQVDLIEPTSGALDLVSTEDPRVTATKLVYTEFGMEPHGVLLAALEAWARDPAATIAAMERRASKVDSPGWADAVVESVFAYVLRGKAHGAFAAVLQSMADVAHGIDDLRKDASCRVAAVTKLFGLDPRRLHSFLDRLTKTTTYRSSPKIQLVFDQVFAVADDDQAKVDAIVAGLGTSFDAKSAKDLLDVKHLADGGALAKALTEPSSKGKLTLAVMGVIDPLCPDACKEFVKKVRHPGAPVVPGLEAVPPVPAVLEQPAPRAEVPEVPEVKGRPKVEKIADKRAEVAEVPDLPKLDKLDPVPAPEPPEPGKEAPPPVVAPGRVERKGRDKVDEVPAVKPFFEESHEFNKIAAGMISEAALMAKVG